MIRDPEAPGGERPKILDFGIAKLGDDASARIKTRTGAVLGTPVYMSPEQCNGASRVDHRADIYSLGCVAFHLLTGRPPFDLPGVGAIISAHLREPPPLASSLVANLPPGIDELVYRCLAKSPDDRFAQMAELQQACDAVLARITAVGAATLAMPSGVMAAPAMPSESRASAPPRRSRLGLWIAGAALAGGAGAAVVVLTTAPPKVAPLSGTIVKPAPIAPPVTPAPVMPAPVPPPPPAPLAKAVEPPPVAAPAPPPPPKAPRAATKTKPPPAAVKPPAEDLYDDRN